MNTADVANLYELGPAGASLLNTLSSFPGFQSTDPRDKVYGLISLVRSEADGDLIIPDYEKTVVQVFADMALSSIISTRQLFVFSHIKHHADYDGGDEHQLWAPRWDQPRIPIMIGNGFRTHENNACGGREAQFVATKDSEGGYLCLTGMVHATVTTVDTIFGGSSFQKPDPFQRQHLAMEMCEGVDLDNRKSDKMGILARTITAGRSTEFRRLEYHDKESLCAQNEKFIHYLEWCSAPMADSSNLRGDAFQCQDAAKFCCLNLRFFCTTKEDYGIGPGCMREGDIVVVFYGGNAPYVLRPKGGDKYLMHGELVKEVEEGKRQEQQFCLI